MSRTKGLLPIGLLLALALLVTPALADSTRFGDPDDTPGRFDFRALSQGHDQGSVVHKLATYGRWSKATFGTRKDSNFMNLFFDTDGKAGYERRLTIDVDKDGKLAGTMMDWTTKETLGAVALTRPNRRSVKVTIPTTLLGPGVTSYRWYSGSFFHADNKGPCGTPSDVVKTCIDRFPERGLATHNL